MICASSACYKNKRTKPHKCATRQCDATSASSLSLLLPPLSLSLSFFRKPPADSRNFLVLCFDLGFLSLMGANLFALFCDPNGVTTGLVTKLGLGDLPECCVALIIGSFDPTEICRFAKLNRAFHGASFADFVWESKLPSNYQTLIEKVFCDLKSDLGKREIYTGLCRMNSVDGGTKKVWLDKNTRGVCLSISAKGLAITGINDRRYWSHIPTEESRFTSVTYL